jgi:hypothetical protein
VGEATKGARNTVFSSWFSSIGKGLLLWFSRKYQHISLFFLYKKRNIQQSAELNWTDKQP